MPTLVICAASSVTHAGLAALATSASNPIVEKTNSLSELSRWLQTQTADLAIVELSSTADINELAQIIEAIPPEESIPFLLMVDISLKASGEENTFSQLAAQLLSLGLVSILPMTVSANEMSSAIAAITQNLVILHPEITERLFDAAPFSPIAFESDSPIEPLTPREIEVLNQLASGLTNKAIARHLNISEHTAKFHISTILSKLDASSRTEAVSLGIKAGLVRL